jgi:hypothetical protein
VGRTDRSGVICYQNRHQRTAPYLQFPAFLYPATIASDLRFSGSGKDTKAPE